MGTTIGINSFLLLAIAYDILQETCRPITAYARRLSVGYWTANISLLIFWSSLIIAGILKAKWQMSINQVPFSTMMTQLRPCFVIMMISGLTMAAGFVMIIYPLIKNQLVCYINRIAKRERAARNLSASFAID